MTSLDTAARRLYWFAVVGLFRSSLFAALVSLLVMMGYAMDIPDAGCSGQGTEQAGHCKGSSGESAPSSNDDGCQCLCHQTFCPIAAEPVRAMAAALAPTQFSPSADEFPPETVPLGIDYPPQLA